MSVSPSTGSRCDVNVNECLPRNPCANGGVCIDGVAAFVCMCPLPFTGNTCQQSLDPCQRQTTCSHGATCQPSEDLQSFTCACPPGFTGRDCSVDVDECQAPPTTGRSHVTRAICANGATCVNLVGTFSCACELLSTNNTVFISCFL